MHDPVEVSRCRQPREARTHALVLISRGITCNISNDSDAVRIYVEAADAARARAEIEAYRAENASDPGDLPLRQMAAPHVPAAAGVGLYLMVLFGVFGLQRRHSLGLDWTELGASQVGAMLNGEFWRAATALTLHGDLGHLFSNLFFGAVVGTMVAGQFGAGLGWLAIVWSGVLGNLLNAAFQPEAHTAIGASTAVFGALGFLAGAAQRARRSRWRLGLRRWSPVAAGAMLLAFLGFGGERTDIGAHIAGFAVGVALGLLVMLLPPSWTERLAVQWISALLAAATIGGAWLAAVA